MDNQTVTLSLILVFLFAISIVSAEISIDVSGLKQEAYSMGEELTYTVRLLQDNTPVSKQVEVTFSDALSKKEITKTVTSNQENSLLIEKDFASGLWNIQATYDEKVGQGIFTVAETSQVEFTIEQDKLINQNKGNTRYQKTIQITIGSKVQTITGDIKVDGKKELILIAPKGSYNIKVTDGQTTISKSNVELHGTGNVVGAVDKALAGGYTGLGVASDPDSLDDGLFSSKRNLASFIFVIAVLGIGTFLLLEKRFRKNN